MSDSTQKPVSSAKTCQNSTSIRYVLGVDSAMNGCGAALYIHAVENESDRRQDDAGSVSRILPMMRGQAEALVPLVQDVVREARIAFSDIDLVCTTIGPGTFTGLRVGMSAARSFALALDVPLVGVTTLDVLAQQYLWRSSRGEGVSVVPHSAQRICVLIETKRSDYYVQFFDAACNALTQPQALEGNGVYALLSEFDALVGGGASGSVVIIGDATRRFADEFPSLPKSSVFVHDGFSQPDALVLARLGAMRYGDGREGAAADAANPLYLRGADVSMPKTPPRILRV